MLVQYKQSNTFYLLSGIALLFHAVGAIGIRFFPQSGIVSLSPYSLLLFYALLVGYHLPQVTKMVTFTLIVGVLGIALEAVGVATGLIFGLYNYGDVLGFKVLNVPIIIGLNWCLLIAGSASLSAMLFQTMWHKVLSAAAITTVLDMLIEPVAIKLGYWTWGAGVPPLQNYIAWWAASLAFSWVYLRIFNGKPNFGAAVLFMLQTLFFLSLQTF